MKDATNGANFSVCVKPKIDNNFIGNGIVKSLDRINYITERSKEDSNIVTCIYYLSTIDN